MTIARLEELEKKISIYDNAYHNLDIALISDADYDLLVREYESLLKLFPDHVTALTPGFTENKGTLVPLTEPMLSIAKINDWDKLLKLSDRYKDYSAEEKADGVAVRLVYDKNGSIIFVHLKGNGYTGKDISHRKYLIAGIPDTIDNDTGVTIDVTGEVVCLKDDYDDYNAQSKEDIGHARGVVSGFLRRDEPGEDDGDLPLYFIAFHASKPVRDKFTRYPKLREWFGINGFESPVLFDTLPEEKPDSIYPIDGIVIKNNDLSKWDDNQFTGYNSYSACFKYPTEIATTTTTGVSWGVNSQGFLTGVLLFNPVRLNDTNVGRCQFHYPDTYIRNGLRIGSKIEVTKGNEIIPKLISVIENGTGKPIEFPEECPCCDTKLTKEGIGSYRCENMLCSGQLTVRLRKAVSPYGFDIDGLGTKRIESLIGSDSIVFPSQLFSLTQTILTDAGISKKIAKKVLVQIEEAKKLPICNWLYAAAIPNLGEVRCLEIQSLLKEKSCKNADDLMTILASNEMTELFGLDGVPIISYVSNNYSDLYEFFELIDFSKAIKETVDAIPVAITGTGEVERKVLKDKLFDLGYWLDNKVTKSTYKLLVGAKPSPGKVGLAERYDIPVVLIQGMSIDDIVTQLEKR